MIFGIRKKRIYLINRDFQMRYIRTSVTVAVCTTMLTLFLVLYPLFYLNVLRFPDFLPTPFLVAAIAAAVMNISVIAYLGIQMSHRIAGPVFAMVRYLRILQSGNYSDQMRVRESDELKYLARHLNELAEVLETRTRDDVRIVEQVIATLEQSPSNASQSQVLRALEICKVYKTELESRVTRSEVEPIKQEKT